MYFAAAAERSSEDLERDIGISILYDNFTFTQGPKADWGFSCLVTGTEKTVLFDTGAKGELLLENIEKLNVDPQDIEVVVISHDHGDHTGGLLAFLGKNSDVTVYLPPSCKKPFIGKVRDTGARVIVKNDPVAICKGIHLTGAMGKQIVEQSMIVETAEGAIVITGCAHPGIVEIVRKSKDILRKDIHMVFGGFHLPQKSQTELREIITEFRKLGVRKAGPTHCTGNRAIQAFRQAYGSDFAQMGVGRALAMTALPK
ncbi:MAG: MBL fold metallo-hydrolase [Planctomycetota bacterium]|jgi:7,8-dihydropterin-6-yl-methyl-4-(beta-D-ribofuranosyl)aminobenzene 5'-phosphate synthase